jgi:hypothetical protein
MEQVNKDAALAEKRQDLSNLLHEHVCEVTFTKVNGEVRIMPCTLKSNIVPVIERKDAGVEKKKNDETISVWCMDKKEWRSFRVANVIKVEVLNHE